MEHTEVLPHTREIDKSSENVLRNTTCRIKVGGIRTEPFDIHGGLKQGCVLSTLLFNLVLEWIMRNTPPTRLPIHLDNTIIDRLGYADDVDFCGEHLSSIEETYIQFKNNAERTGMKINMAKTKVREVSRTPNLVGDMDFGGSQLEAVLAPP
ncbi:uncharacterized protein [Palaemon carinicauda]|uniref:uncharacterized protein n=1 Tax=Palaemon carinicauda TaxID=392227 RepID=UPI0035B61771